MVSETMVSLKLPCHVQRSHFTVQYPHTTMIDPKGNCTLLVAFFLKEAIS